MASISVAKSRGATLRVGPELEIPSVSILQPSCFRSDLHLLVVMVVTITFWKVRISHKALLVAHYHTGDTVLHSWEVLAKILSSDEITGIVCDVGM